MNSEVAVVIPVFNDRERLIEAIRSIVEANQVGAKFYVVDDASYDGTAAHVEQFLLENSMDHLVLRNDVNRGAGFCRNEAFRNVKEKYTLFLDADDFIYPGMLDKAVHKAEMSSSQLILTEYERVFEINDRKLGMISQDRTIFDRLGGLSQGEVVSIKDNGYLLGLVNYPWNKLVLTSYAKLVGLHFSETPVHNDVLAHWVLLMNASRISALHEPFCGHRVSPTANQITNISDDRRMAMLDVFDELENYFYQNPVLKTRFYHHFLTFKIKLFKWALRRLKEEYRDIFKESFSKTFKRITRLELIRLSEMVPDTANEVMRFRLGIN